MARSRRTSLLIRRMTPRIQAGTFVYCAVTGSAIPAGLDVLCTFREREGLTLIVERQAAQRHALRYEFQARLITLCVQSDLRAVGFLAVVTQALSRAGVPCNVVSAFHHDHLLVPAARSRRALRALRAPRRVGSR